MIKLRIAMSVMQVVKNHNYEYHKNNFIAVFECDDHEQTCKFLPQNTFMLAYASH